jgi:hypothetical protein
VLLSPLAVAFVGDQSMAQTGKRSSWTTMTVWIMAGFVTGMSLVVLPPTSKSREMNNDMQVLGWA